MANSQKFTLTFDAQLNVNQMKGALNSIQSELSKLKLPANISKGLQDTFDKLSSEIKNFENVSAGGINSKNDLTKLETSANKVLTLYEKLQSQAKSLGNLSSSQLEKLFPESVTKNIEAARAALKGYADSAKAATKDLEKANAAVKKINSSIAAEQGKTTVTTGQYKQISEDLKAAETEVDTYKQKIEELTTRQRQMETDLSAPKKSSKYRDLIKELEEVRKKYEEASQKAKELSTQKANVTTNEKQAEALAKLNVQLTEAQQKANAAAEALHQIESVEPGGGVQQLIQVIGQLTGLDMSQFSNDVNGAAQALQTYLSNALNDTTGNLRNFNQVIEQNHAPAQQMKTDTDECAVANQRLNDSFQQVQAIKKRIQYFFGLENAINLVKRAIRGAFDTIKELDKVMTETAVVTDFSVSDMWEQLPEYTKRANELGVTTKAAYEAATLYYQQGLKTNEVNALSVETLKMARIAGLDAAEATDRMTNALRGFNMELTQANAQRVDDVYSELAANTASNVDEISTAMTKVASLAHNANMEFETTAAFLAQIIETTRESAETAGTALKTVVARFSEVKKLVDEGQIRGTDEEGSAIDVNRVGAALRTAGIDLNKYFLGEVGLDDIFMELASKWDSLTSMQQRYIATQAAGSRQQSRFIALMQDYARTQELVGKAYASSGASEKQFEKTQESLESKLNRLKNAWNEFLMGLTNNEIIKGAVDLLTDVLNTINKLTDAFGESGSSIAKWVLAIGGLKAIGGLFKNGGLFDKVLSNSIFSSFLGSGAGAAATGGASLKGFGRLTQSLLDFQDSKGIIGISGAFDKLGASIKATLGSFKAFVVAAAPVLAVMAAMAGYAYLANNMRKQEIEKMDPAAAQKKQLELTKQNAEAMKEWTDRTQEQSRTLKEIQSTQTGNFTNINEAQTTSEYREAIQAQNDYIKSLIEKDAQYSKYVQSIEGINGEIILTLDEQALAEACNLAAEAAVKSAAAGQFSQSAVASGSNAVLQANLNALQEKYYSVTDENGKTKYYRRNEAEAIHTEGGDFYRPEVTVEISEEEYKGIVAQEQANIAEQQKNSQQAQINATNAFSEMGWHLELDSSTIKTVSTALGSAFDVDTYSQAILDSIAQQEAFYKNNNFSEAQQEADLRQKYYERYGVQASNDLSISALINALATYDQSTKQMQQMQDFAALINADEAAKQMALAFTGQIESEEQLFNWDENGDSVFNSAAEKIRQALGLGADDFVKKFQEAQTGVKNRKTRAKEKYYNIAALSGATIDQNTQNQIQSLNLQDVEHLGEIAETLKETISPEGLAPILEQLPNVGSEQLEEISTFLQDLNLENPIQAFTQLKTKLDEVGESSALGNVITQIQSTNSELFTASNLVQSFITSSDYDEITESLDKFVETNGKISASNIKELAESNKALNTLLKNNIISAKGLAAILNEIQKGTINFTDLNDAIIAAADSMDNLDDIAKQTIDDLNGFDPGYDENDITGFITKVYENAKENFEKGAYGNNVMANYMKKIFGDFEYSGPEEGYGEAYKTWLKGNIAWLEANKDNMFSAWDNFVGEQNKRILESGEKTAEILEQNGEIVIHANGMTTQELIDAMAASGEMTAEQARMMITDFKNYSADFAHEMALNDLPNAIQAWYDALPKMNGQKIFSETDFKTLSTLLGVSEQEIREAINNLKQDAGTLTAIDWTGGTGERSPEAYIKQLEALGATLKKTWLNDNTGIPETSNLFNFDAVRKSVQQAGIGEEFQYIFDGIIKEGESFTATIAGDLQTIEVKAGETATDAYNRVVQELADDRLAGKIGEQVASALADLENVEINFTPNTGEAEEAINTINDQLSETGEITVSPTIEADNTDALIKDEEVNTALTTTDGITATPAIDVSDGASTVISQVDTGLTNLNGKRATTYLDIISTLYSQAGARGGLVQSLAGGTGGPFLQPGFALTGEEGPEIIWNKNEGYAYVTGRNGAEFQNLQPGDRVFNAAETQRIFRNSSFAAGGIFPSFATGYEGVKKPGSGRGGDSSDFNDSKKESTWRNELDWLYDLMEDIAEYEHQQTILQSKYDLALKDITQTGRDLYNLTKKELVNLETQLTAQQAVQVKRLQQMGELQTQVNAAGYGEYVQYNQKDKTLEIDWDAIEAIQDKDTYDEITDWISRMEEVQDQIEDAEETIFDIKKQIQELQDRYLQSYLDFQNRVMDALVQQYQDQIDNLSTLNDTLNDTNNNILDSIQKEIDLERQIRDNTDTEKNIADIEARLAFLQRDTTGANAVEIKQLEKQLADARENYSDTLVDQAINRLSQSNEEAAQQREKQIELMQAQLDYWKESGALWNEVNSLIKGGFDGNGSILLGSDLTNLLKDADNWDAMSQAQRENWANELILDTNEVGAHIVTMTEEMNYQADKINSLLTSLTGKIGGTPEHSYTATKTEEKYATGGLNTYTGWAHLDGTPTEPEYVLNARQTDAFLRLADVLPNMMSSNTSTTNNLTNNPIFNISVNVDSISNDYDVDKLIDRVKDNLADALSYRNVNALSFIR